MSAILTITETILLEKKTKIINPTFKAIFFVIQLKGNVFGF